MAADSEPLDPGTGAKPKKKSPLLVIGLIGGIALVQAGGFFAFIKFFYATPAPTYGQGGEQAIAGSAAEHGPDNAAHGDAASKDGHAAADDGHGAAAAVADGHGDGHGSGHDPPAATEAAPAVPRGTFAEVELIKKYKVPNNTRGIAYLYDFDIAMVVESAKKQQAAALVTANQAQIYDRIGQIVRAAPPRVLDEVDFRNLRVQIRAALHEIFDDESLVQQVLIPRCVPIRTD